MTVTRRRYDDDELRRLTAEAWCLSDLLRLLDVEATKGRRRHVLGLVRRLQLDTAHWAKSPNRVYSRAQLEAAVAASISFAGVLRQLGLKQAGGTHAYLARRIRREGISTAHFLGPAHNRGRPGRQRPSAEYLAVLPPGSQRTKTRHLRRALREAGVADCCAACGIRAEWQGRPLTLMIDHINGEWLDNRLENLRLLCPNCHSQTSTWCRRKPSACAS